MKVKELLSDSSKWTQGSFAKDKFGEVTKIDSKDATCWCLQGALQLCYGNYSINPSIYDKVKSEINRSIPGWNDTPERTFEDVKQLVETLDI